MDLEKLSGIVKRITFHSVETGYTLLKINSFQRPQEDKAQLIIGGRIFREGGQVI